MSAPSERELVHAGRAADHILALVVAREPQLQPAPQLHDATTALVVVVAAALATAGGVR